jgi:SAM-dependent methyltransferase
VLSLRSPSVPVRVPADGRANACCHHLAVRRFYEDLWERLPDPLDPPERERRLAFLAEQRRGAERILDLGCGDGTFTAAAGAGAIGADIAEAALARARRDHPRLRFVRVPADGPLPFAAGEFDLVWCSETLEHVADTAGFLAEVRRVLTPGGRLAVTVPRSGPLRALVAWRREFHPLGDHLRFYTAATLRDVLDDAGFAEVGIRSGGGLLLAGARRPR